MLVFGAKIMNRLLLRKCLALQMLIFDAGRLQIRQNWLFALKMLIFKKTGGFGNPPELVFKHIKPYYLCMCVLLLCQFICKIGLPL